MISVYNNERDWLAARSRLLTASDVPCLLGVGDEGSPWFRTPDELFAEKVGTAPDRVHSAEVEEWRRWGHKLEPILRAEYAERTKRAVRELGAYTIVTSDEYPWFGATLDLVATHETLGAGPVQIKNVGYSQRSEWMTKPVGMRRLADDGVTVPLEKQIQVQAEILAFGSKWGGIGALIGGNTFVVREIARHDKFINEKLLPAALAFRKRVEEYRKDAA